MTSPTRPPGFCGTCGRRYARADAPDTTVEECPTCHAPIEPAEMASEGTPSLFGELRPVDEPPPAGRPMRSGLLPIGGASKFTSDLRRVPVPRVGPGSTHRADRPTLRSLEQRIESDSTLEITDQMQAELERRLSSDDLPRSPSAPRTIKTNVNRQQVAKALSAFDAQLGEQWVDLLTADRFPALLVKLERLRRATPGPRIDEAIMLVTALQHSMLRQLLDTFEASLAGSQLDRADTLLQQARVIADEHPRLVAATAALARAHDDRQASREGELKLERARELGGPPHQPRSLKQAIKLYDDLLRRIERYPSLKPAFDLIKGEREDVEQRINAADQRESERRTAIAIGEIDGLVATRSDYLAAMTDGSLDRRHAQDQVDHIERLIGERLAPKVREFLEDSDEIARNPRDAQVALDRLSEHKRLWIYLPPELRSVVERREEDLRELIARRKSILVEVDEATRLIQRGDYAGAIRQLSLQAQLHAQFQIDVSRPIQIAADAFAQQLQHRLAALEMLDTDLYVDEVELESALGELRTLDEHLEPVADKAVSLGELRTRVSQANQGLRALRGRLVRFDQQAERIQQSIDQGRANLARKQLERLGDHVPLQRKSHVADLKDELDVTIADDEVEARLHMLAVSDRAQAIEWASAHSAHRACRRFLLETQTDARLQQIARLEQEGQPHAALELALSLSGVSDGPVQARLDETTQRLYAVLRDQPEVERRLRQARLNQSEGRDALNLVLLAEDLVLPAHLVGEWRFLHQQAQAVADRARLAEWVAELDAVRLGREAWQSWPTPMSDPLGPPSGSTSDARDAHRALDEALRRLERLSAGQSFLERIANTPSLAEGLELNERLTLERRLCAAERHIAHFEFGEARALVDGTVADRDPGVARVRTRLRRIEFGRLIGRAIEEREIARVRVLIEEYPAQSADEALLASRLLELVVALDDALARARDAESAAGTLSILRSARRDFAAFIAAHPFTADVLKPTRRVIEDALVVSIERLFESWEDDILPGRLIAQYAVVDDILGEEPVITSLESWRDTLEPQIAMAGREVLDWIESQAQLESLASAQLVEIERRLDQLASHMTNMDPQFERCRRRVRQVRTDMGRQLEAQRRYDTLIKRALETLDTVALDEACRLERSSLVSGDRAQRMRASWQQAEPVVGELQRAMAERAFSRVEQLLDRLLETGSVAHIDRLELPHPFEQGHLPRGAHAVRRVLPVLRAQAEQAVAERAREIEEVDLAIDGLHRSLRQRVGDAPALAEPEQIKFLERVCGEAEAEIGRLSARVEALYQSAGAGTGDSIQALAARLPPQGRADLRAFIVELVRHYRHDHAMIMRLSHAPLKTIRQSRAGLLEVRRRWEGLPDLMRLIDSMLRLI